MAIKQLLFYTILKMKSTTQIFPYADFTWVSLRNGFINLTSLIRLPNSIGILYHNTYLLTPWSRVILEKLTGSTASQEIPRIFGTRRFLTVPTSARHLSLS